MIDPNSVFDWSALLAWWDPKAMLAAAASLASGMAVSYGLHRWQRGRRLGTLTTDGVLTRRGWLRTRLELVWSPKAVDTALRIGGLGVFALASYLGIAMADLPGGALAQGALALAATANLWFYQAHSRGRCQVFRKGLWVEGVFYPWDQVALALHEGEAVFEVGKNELRLPAGLLDRCQDWLNTPLRVKWICLRAP